MMKKNINPRVLLISQWPKVKNAEFELIEKIRKTGYKITIVDYLGFDVETGNCINDASLCDEYDFAISFHYDTPKFLNVPTFLWVANPLEYMHLRGDYRSIILNNCRAYDDYLYNGSDLLKGHIKQIVGREWKDTGLTFYAACSSNALLVPRLLDRAVQGTSTKIFYCGVNWERGIDKSGRAQGLLDILQEKQTADFYGPKALEGINPWEGFTSYRGEIPFDGISMSSIMQEYGAVLALSSPAHIKSCTSSSRVFEGFAAGVPVISNENPHVRQLFDELVYYFSGTTEQEQATSILEALDHIRSNPEDAIERVHAAQTRISEHYCFEETLTHLYHTVQQSKAILPGINFAAADEQPCAPTVDIFLFDHDPYSQTPEQVFEFTNTMHIMKAAEFATRRFNARVRIFHRIPGVMLGSDDISTQANVEMIPLNKTICDLNDWANLRLGEKVERFVPLATGNYAVFLTQFDFPQYDYLEEPLKFFELSNGNVQDMLFVGGFFVNDLAQKAPLGTSGILRNNASVGLYRWTQNSIAEHQLGQFYFSRGALDSLDFGHLSRFDVLFSIAIIFESTVKRLSVHRDRHLLLRVEHGYFHRHYKAYARAVERGFWAQHYELLSNYSHELNALYDAFHEYPDIVALADQVSGYALPSLVPVDPAVHVVNQFISRLRPLYRFLKRIKRMITMGMV